MTAVAVELEDLETIVFATGVIKAIEDALASHRRDPFVQPHLNFKAAHDRLASAMRNATRAEAGTLTNFDEPLTKAEVQRMRYVVQACDAKTPGLALFVISPEDKGDGEYESLVAKGCIEMGQFVQGVVWAGAPAPQITADPKGYAARPTARGISKLKEAEKK